MSGIRSYDLSGDQVMGIIRALEGDPVEKIVWLEKLHKWVNYRNRQMEIIDLVEEWLTDFGKRTGVHIGRHEWDTDEDNLRDWVYYQMEYTSGIVWDNKTQKAIINKYASSRPLLNAENTQALLDYITENLEKA